MKDLQKTTGYIWYNPDLGLYQKGRKEEFDNFYASSGRKEQFSLILRLTPISDLLAYKIVRELNANHSTPQAAMRMAI